LCEQILVSDVRIKMQEVNVQVAVRVSIQLGVKLRRILTNSQIIYTVVLNFNFLVLWFYAILYAT